MEDATVPGYEVPLGAEQFPRQPGSDTGIIKKRRTLSPNSVVECCQFQQSSPRIQGLAECQWALFQTYGSLAPCSKCACGFWYCETHRPMGCHMCPLFKTMPSGSNTSSPASPTEPGDSDLDLDDGWDNQEIHLPWINESNMLQVPTPIRKSSLGSHETGLSPTYSES